MKNVVALLALALAVAPVTALQVSGNSITLSDDERAQCMQGGGCVFITREALQEAVAEMAKKRAGDCMVATSRKGIV